MRSVTLARDGTKVTIEQGEDECADRAADLAELLHNAMLGLGYHPESVASAMVEVGESYSTEEKE